jgi:integrase/recombinase XerD
MEHLIERYLGDLRIEGGLALNTIQAYRRDLQKLQRYLALQQIDDPAQATRQILSGFLGHLKHSRLSAASSARCLAALRGFYRFLRRERLAEEDPLLTLSRPRPWM